MHVDAVLIAGPTASGKSAAALALAEAIGGSLINCDSMQVYSQLRILTARPSDEEMARVPHHLYGHVGVWERYSAGRYQAEAAEALAKVRRDCRIPIFVGGTGLYFGALTEGLSEIPQVPAHIHEALRNRLLLQGNEAFYRELKLRDPETAAQIRPTDPQRVLRAMEVLEATGRSLASWQKESGEPVLKGLKLARFVLDPPRVILHPRIAERYKRMVEQGALEEARKVAGLDEGLPASKIIGLREFWEFDIGRLAANQVEEAIVTATRQYAKRQTTWFRNKMADWTWLPAYDHSNIIAEMRKFLK
ncbi:MAG TPA: tRNA (adenosine(37)-N6)-dimethylallyltransferase MiaA [Rhizomicrobium sp.]|nr:tRNA (adenosine(37)-N6)-dimethylallyltransferase MiaA [Rhizomicrobium sp.]